MSLPESLYAKLVTVAPLAGGWFPLRIPESAALPAGTYQRVSGFRDVTHDGGVDISTSRYQLTIYSERYGVGRLAAEDIVAALSGVRSAWDGLDVTAIIADEAEDIDPEPRGLFRQRIDVFLRAVA